MTHAAWGLAAGLAMAAAVATGPASAQDYPKGTVTVVVPYTPGGATDIIGRVVAQGLQKRLGGNFVVENVSGAAGSLGASRVARADADGQTLLFGALTSHSINMNLEPKPNFDLKTSFAPVALAGNVALAVVVNPSLPVKNIQELVALAKSKPDELTYASSGPGSPQHLAGEMFNRAAGTKIRHVPYRGSSPAVVDLMGGQVTMFIDTVPSVQPHVQSGKLKLLAVTTPEPSPQFPQAPTLDAEGLKGFDVSSWFGLLAPAKVSPEIVAKLNGAANETLKDPVALETLRAQGVTPAPGSPEDAAELIAAQIDKWAEAVKAADVKQ